MPDPSTHESRDPREVEARRTEEEESDESEEHPRGTLFLMPLGVATLLLALFAVRRLARLLS